MLVILPVEGAQRLGLARLLRYCARPRLGAKRLREIDADHLVYESAKPGPGGSGNVSLRPTPIELIGGRAPLIPPSRRHWHRYYRVQAPSTPLRAQSYFRLNSGRPYSGIFQSSRRHLPARCALWDSNLEPPETRAKQPMNRAIPHSTLQRQVSQAPVARRRGGLLSAWR